MSILKNGKISFHINFLKYLWAMAYSLFSYSHYIIELETKQEWDGNALELNNIFEIFFMKEWARMLKNTNEYFPWTPHLSQDSKTHPGIGICTMLTLRAGKQRVEVDSRL